VFISHASEDKNAIVRPLATELERLSVKVWYDEFSLKLGDSLSVSIDKGLKESRFGLLVLSKSFLCKNWPEYEYRSLLTRQIDGENVILPLWYGVTKEDVKGYSLFLADIMSFLVSEDNLAVATLAILRVIRPDIWQGIRMGNVLRKAIEKAEPVLIKRSQLKMATSKQSQLTRQQIVRSKAIYYGIGRHLNLSFDKYVDNYELDMVPERELQSWEIMNASYFEMLDRHPDATERDKKDYFNVLIALSMGMNYVNVVKLEDEEGEELCRLWRENYYEF
jgi:hypothetical protein